jgi:hypothetical protein
MDLSEPKQELSELQIRFKLKRFTFHKLQYKRTVNWR